MPGSMQSDQLYQAIPPLLLLTGVLGVLLMGAYVWLYGWAFRPQVHEREGQDVADAPYYDILTGLPSDRLFRILLGQALMRSARSKRLLALLIFELEQLTVLNEQHGHVGGDLAVRVLAARVRGCVGSTDTVSRLGGDQFAVMLEHIQSPEEAATIAQRILKAVVLPLTLAGHEILINTSIGIALHPSDGVDSDGLLNNAAAAMNTARVEGLPIQFHSAQINDQVFEGRPADASVTAVPNR